MNNKRFFNCFLLTLILNCCWLLSYAYKHSKFLRVPEILSYRSFIICCCYYYLLFLFTAYSSVYFSNAFLFILCIPIAVRLEDNLCANRFFSKLFKDPSMTLRDDRESAAIITQVWNTTMPGIYSSNKIRYDCEFRVHGDEPKRPPRGIYTVITRLKFRHDPVKNECLDYIQFRDGNRSPSERICNDISRDGPAGRLIFDQRNRDLSVVIHIDKKRMITEPLELRAVLTAHSECKYTGDFLCEPTDPHTCISRYFVRDNITNCMYPCRDEVSCFHDAVPLGEMDTTNVALSAITSLIFTMLGVGFCVWVCWKYWNCITVQQHAHEASAVTNRSRRQRQYRNSVQRVSRRQLSLSKYKK